MKDDQNILEQLVTINLDLIKKSSSQSLHSRSFQVNVEEQSVSRDNLIKLMEDEHLIETESTPDIYFLTEHGYNTLEEGSLKIQLASELESRPRLTLNNLGEAIENSQSNRKKVYGIVWFALFAFTAISTFSYLGTKDESSTPTRQFKKTIVEDSTNVNTVPQEHN